MNSLRMLAEVIESREPSVAMALKRPLSSMLPDMPCQMFAAGETQPTWRKVCAIESLTLFLFPWSLSIAGGTVVIRVVLVVVVIAHLDILIFISFR